MIEIIALRQLESPIQGKLKRMLSKPIGWMRSHRRLTACLVVALGLIALNVVAFNQAWSMTHFSEGGERTPNPESLSLLGKFRVAIVGVNLPKPVNGKDPAAYGLAFETHHLGGADGQELEAWHIPCAKAKGLVLLAHGYGGCKASLLLEAKPFIEWATRPSCSISTAAEARAATTLRSASARPTIVAQAVEYVRRKLPTRHLIFTASRWGVLPFCGRLLSTAFDRTPLSSNARSTVCFRQPPTVSPRWGCPPFPAAHLLIFWGGVQQGFNAFRHNPSSMRGTCRVRSCFCTAPKIHG